MRRVRDGRRARAVRLTHFTLFLALSACGSSSHSSPADTHPAPYEARLPSLLTGLDPPHRRLAVNFYSVPGIGWKCFEMETQGQPDDQPPVGRCYRTTKTCIDSRQYWGQYYAVNPCGEKRIRYAACLQGRERRAGDYFAICFTQLVHCEQAQAQLTTEPRKVEFVSECLVLR